MKLSDAARVMGQAKTPKKADAARLNGTKGGRPITPGGWAKRDERYLLRGELPAVESQKTK